MSGLVRRLDPRRTALVLALAIAVLAALGAVVAWSPRPALVRFDLDGERNVPAAFSAFLLLACAALALLLPRSIARRGVALLFGFILVFASLDEAGGIHEKLESRLDVDWQVLYIPVAVATLAVWVLVALGLRRVRGGLVLMLGSGACWAVSQGFEALQWDDDDEPAAGYTWMMVTEETLEMVGSALLVLALLHAVRAERPEP
jgi:hypothetical protein